MEAFNCVTAYMLSALQATADHLSVYPSVMEGSVQNGLS